MVDVPEVSVILPTFNEAENIVPLIHRLREVMRDWAIEIVVVDDNSPDGTARLVEQRYGGDPCVRVIIRERDPGLAFSIREGIERSKGTTIVVMDTDFNHAPEDVHIMCAFARHVDIVIGSRFIFGGGMSDVRRYYMSYAYNIALRLAIGTRIDDNLSGFFAVRRAALARLDYDQIFWGYGDYFFRLLLVSQRSNMKHVQLPVFYAARRGGQSKTRMIAIFMKYTREMLRLAVRRFTDHRSVMNRSNKTIGGIDKN
jgi:dolichol-phosphate mannosyltransferase